jgi:RNA polymerase sigma factor (sigma-70 family)
MEVETNEQLAARIAAGDESCFPQLLEQTKLLIWREAKRHTIRMCLCENAADDLFQEGCIELLRVARRFDASLGYKFVTALMFALKRLRQKIQGFSVIHYPRHKDRGTYSRQRVAAMNAFSLDAADDDRLPMSATVPHVDRGHAEFSERQKWLDEYRPKFAAMIHPLDDRRKRAVVMRLEGFRLNDIGAELGVSKERVRQLLKSAFEWIGVPMSKLPSVITCGRKADSARSKILDRRYK